MSKAARACMSELCKFATRDEPIVMPCGRRRNLTIHGTFAVMLRGRGNQASGGNPPGCIPDDIIWLEGRGP